MNRRKGTISPLTKCPIGTFKFRDPHPFLYHCWFKRYRNGKEEWTYKSPEQIKEQNGNWQSKNRDNHRNANRRYYKNNKEKCFEHVRNRRVRKKGASVPLDEDESAMMDNYYDQCKRLNQIFGQGTWHADHTIPISKGGKHHPSNLQVVPAKWNYRKGAHSTSRWEAPFGK